MIFPSTNQNQTITFPCYCGPDVWRIARDFGGCGEFRFACYVQRFIWPRGVDQQQRGDLTGAGTVTVQANQVGNGSFNAAPAVSVSSNVARAEQAITFAVLEDKSAGDPPFSVDCEREFRIGGLLRFVSGPATVSSNLVTVLGGGTVTIVAWQPGNSNFNAAAVSSALSTCGRYRSRLGLVR